MSDIVLSAGVRSNLLQLQKTADLITSTQTKLATGKRVNTALDNPINFFTAQGLSNRASDLGNLLDSMFNGINLLNSTASANLTLTLNESGTSTVTVNAVNFTATGLALNTSANNWALTANITAASTDLSAALTSLRSQSQAFGSNLSTVQIRQDFTKAMINTLQTGADNLTLADSNEEGANLLALQTRQQLSTTALSLASQASQAVLKLFQ